MAEERTWQDNAEEYAAQRVRMPASVEEAVESLNGLGRLLRAKEWERAAIVATFVRLGAHQGRPPRNRRATPPVMSAKEFARLGIQGLTDYETVTLYVNRWLAENGGEYPSPEEVVDIPKVRWPPTSLEDARYQAVDDREAIRAQAEADGTGASKAVDIAKNTKAMAAAIKASPSVAAAALAALPREVIAAAVRDPDIAKAVNDDFEASTAIIRDVGSRQKPRPIPTGGSSVSDQASEVASGLANLVLRTLLDAVERDIEGIHREVVVKGAPLSKSDTRRLVRVNRMWHAVFTVATTSVTDDDLEDLLQSEQGREGKDDSAGTV